MPITRKQLGNMISEARLARGLTVRDVAKSLGMDASYYSKIETGQNPLGKHAKAIAKLLRLNAAELEAMALVTSDRDLKLPTFAPYLRAKYDLSDEAIAELQQHFAQVSKRKQSNRGRS